MFSDFRRRPQLLNFDPKAFAKLRRKFESTKFLFNFLTSFKNFEVLIRFVPESECKVTPFFLIHQIFYPLFYAV